MPDKIVATWNAPANIVVTVCPHDRGAEVQLFADGTVHLSYGDAGQLSDILIEAIAFINENSGGDQG